MKKNMVRVLAFVLVLILALGVIPLGALAADDTSAWIQVWKEYYNTTTPSVYDYSTGTNQGNKTGYTIWDGPTSYSPGETIKYSDYNNTVIIGGKLYDFSGFDYIDAIPDTAWPMSEAEAKSYVLPFYNGNIDIPKDTSSDALDKFKETWGYDDTEKITNIYAAYTTHQHRLSYWYADNTTHWRECLVCKKFVNEGFWEQFMYQNWHSDGDEDRVCDVCGHDIPYHEVEVIDSKGGKITVNLDEAPHRKKITATVEVEDGYKLKKLHFTKVRTDGSKQEITRYKKNGEFYTLMPTYDLEVTAEYVKTK